MLEAFRKLAEDLSVRPKVSITISYTELKTCEQKSISAKYDDLLKSVELPGATVPVSELRHWLRLLLNADPKSVVVIS